LRPSHRSPLFPYTTLFRSQQLAQSGLIQRQLFALELQQVTLQQQARQVPGWCTAAGDPPGDMRRRCGEQTVEAGIERFVGLPRIDRKSTRLNSSHVKISDA